METIEGMLQVAVAVAVVAELTRMRLAMVGPGDRMQAMAPVGLALKAVTEERVPAERQVVRETAHQTVLPAAMVRMRWVPWLAEME